MIPLDAFANLDSLSNVKLISMVFENGYAAANGLSTSGTLYIDDIGFGTGNLGYLRLDHFPDVRVRNAMGGTMGVMNTCGYTFDGAVYHDYSRSLMIQYDTDGSPWWCGMYVLFGGGLDGNTAIECDLTEYTQLKFWIRAQDTNNNPEKIKIELIDYNSQETFVIPDDTTSSGVLISDAWQQYTIDLTSKVMLDRSTLKQMNIIFDYGIDADETGTVYIDEIQFTVP
jgi:hypothetical protein